MVAAVPAASVSIQAQWIIRKRQIRLHWKIGAREIERILVFLRHDEERCYLAPALGQINAGRQSLLQGTQACSLCAQRV